MKINRIYILGGCGSGKTYLAKKISKFTRIKHFDLDNIVKKDIGVKVSSKQRDKRLGKVLKEQKWIIEGAYAGTWMNPTLKKANLIIILNPNPRTCKKQILFRYLKRKFLSKRKTNIKMTLKLLNYADEYPQSLFIEHKKIAKEYNKKLIILKNKRQINQFLENLK